MYQVRDGQQVTPTCPVCGCRLQEKSWGGYWHYNANEFGNYGQIDAQGHRCGYVLHDMQIIDNKVMVNISTNYMVPIWHDPKTDT